MEQLTIKDLREHLQKYLDQIAERYDDNQALNIVNNTYFLRGATNILEISRKGFVDLDNPTDQDNEDEEW